MNNIDVAKTEAKLAAYASKNASSILHNAAIINQESASAEAQLTAQKEATRQQRLMAQEDEEQEKLARVQDQKEILDKLANSKSGDADQIMRNEKKVLLKRSTARRTAAEKARQAQLSSSTTLTTPTLTNPTTTTLTNPPSTTEEPTFQIRGLKPVVAPKPEKPYDPFGGLVMKREYSTPQSHLDHPWLEKARTDPAITAGGYDLKEYYARTLFEAFAGLGCFIAEEVGAREGKGRE